MISNFAQIVTNVTLFKSVQGPSIKYVRLFLANFDPRPNVTLCHTSRDLPKVRHTSRTPQFLVGLVQKSRTKVPCTNSISIVREGFCPGVLSGLVFVRSPLLSQYICYNRKLNITLNFMFHMYDKICISVTSHTLPPPLSQTVTPSRTPYPSRA